MIVTDFASRGKMDFAPGCRRKCGIKCVTERKYAKSSINVTMLLNASTGSEPVLTWNLPRGATENAAHGGKVEYVGLF